VSKNYLNDESEGFYSRYKSAKRAALLKSAKESFKYAIVLIIVIVLLNTLGNQLKAYLFING